EIVKRLIFLSIFVALIIYADLPTRRAFPGHARVKLAIRTEAGHPTGVRLRVTNAAGEHFAPLGHLPIPDPSTRPSPDLTLGAGEQTALELHALVYDGAEIDLPLGRYTFAARKGLEYEFVNKQVEITKAENQTVVLSLRKYADFEAQGWY